MTIHADPEPYKHAPRESYARSTSDPDPKSQPEWPRLRTLNPTMIRAHLRALTTRCAADRDAVDDALTCLEMANAVFSHAKIAFPAGDIAGYLKFYTTAHSASFGIHGPQRAYRISVALLRSFVVDLVDLLPAVSLLAESVRRQLDAADLHAGQVENEVRTVLAGISGAVGAGGEAFAVEVYMFHVRTRFRNQEAEEERLRGWAEQCLQVYSAVE